MLVNFTNHPASKWSERQLAAAGRWGEIVDMCFPNVPAAADENDISALADTCCAEICGLAPDAVLVQGEMSLTFAVVTRLLRKGVTALCATSKRVCETTAVSGSTVRKSTFKFIGFREYLI